MSPSIKKPGTRVTQEPGVKSIRNVKGSRRSKRVETPNNLPSESMESTKPPERAAVGLNFEYPPQPQIANATVADAPLTILPVGPLADFAPSSGVWVHALLRDSDYVRALDTEFGRRVGFILRDVDPSKAAPSEIFAQDWAPKRVGLQDGTVKLVGYLNTAAPSSSGTFGSTYQTQGDFHFHKSPYQPVISFGPPEGTWAKHESLPLVLQGGNIVSVGGKIFVSDRAIEENAKDWVRDHNLFHLRDAGFTPRNAEDVRTMLAKAFEVSADDVVIVPSMPGERTRHTDMFLLPLANDTVAIPQIRDDAFDVVGFEHERQLGKKVQRFLDETTERIQRLGVKVERLPMLPPIHLEWDSNAQEHKGLFATPAQSTLFDLPDGADGSRMRRAFVPTLKYEGFPQAYKDKAQGYAREACELFERYGFPARTYDVGEILSMKAGGHCVSYPAP